MMPIKMSEIDTGEAQSVLMVGGSGTGKSIAACSFPGPVLDISMDDRIRPIVEYYKDKPMDVYFERPQKFNDVNDIVDNLEYNCPYKTVILDPITNLSVSLIQYSLDLRGVDRTKGAKERKKGVINLPEVEEYGAEHQGIMDIIFNAKIAQKIHGFNLIFIAHLITVNHYKVGGVISHTTQDILTAGRKAAAFIPTQFDEIYLFRAEADPLNSRAKYLVRTFNDGEVMARTSYMDMPPEIEWTGSRSFYGFISKYFGAKKEKTDV
jgi:hypothetical protein